MSLVTVFRLVTLRYMETSGSILASLLKDLGIEDRVRLDSLQREWTTLFPAPLSLHTCPVDIKNGELAVNVDSPAWLQQLKFFKQDMIKKLRGHQVTEIRFKHGRIFKPRQNAPGDKDAAVQTTKKIQDSDIAWIDRTISDIQDPELKEALRKAITKTVMRNG